MRDIFQYKWKGSSLNENFWSDITFMQTKELPVHHEFEVHTVKVNVNSIDNHTWMNENETLLPYIF